MPESCGSELILNKKPDGEGYFTWRCLKPRDHEGNHATHIEWKELEPVNNG